MSRGSGNSPISQEIIVALQQTGSLDQVIEQLVRARGAIEELNRSAQAGAKSDEALEKAAYEVGAAYEIMAEKIGRATTAAEKNAQAAPWASKQQAALGDLIREMGVYEARSDALTATELRNYQVIAGAATRTGVAVAGANSRTVSTSQGASRAILEISRGVEDFATGGFLGILNNIPGSIQGIGQAAGLSAGAIAGLTAGVSLLSTAAFTLYTHWDKVEEFFQIGVPRPILDSTEELTRKLSEASKVTDELGKKSTLSLTELREYKEATAKVKEFNEELRRRKELEDILSGKSKAERERASAFREAVAETGGEEAVRSLEGAIDPHAVGGKVFNEVRGKDSTPRELAEDMIREAGGGDGRLRDKIVELLGAAYKPAEGSFADRIVKTSPETIEAKKAAEKAGDLRAKVSADMVKVMDKNADDIEKARAQQDLTGKSPDKGLQAQVDLAEKAADRKGDAHEKLVKDNVRRVGPGFDDRLQAEFFEEGRRPGGNIDTRSALVRPTLLAGLKGRNVPEEILGQVADDLLAKAGEAARNMLADGGTPKLVRAEGVAGNKAESAYQKAVDRVDDGYLGPLQQAIARNRLGQVHGAADAVPEATLARGLQQQVAQNLRGAGQDPRLAQGVVANAFKEANEAYSKMFAETGNREQALIGVVQGLLGNLAQEQAAGARRDHNIAQLRAGVNQLWRNAQRNQVQRPTLSGHSH